MFSMDEFSLNSILLLAQDKIIQGQTYLNSTTCLRPGSCQSCLIIYSDEDPRNTKGNERNMSKAQTLLFCHIIALLLSLSLVQSYSDIKLNMLRIHSHYYDVNLKVMTFTVTLAYQKLRDGVLLS